MVLYNIFRGISHFVLHYLYANTIVVVDDIPYYTLNSATYAWCGTQIMSSEKLKEMYGYLNGMLLYKQALCVDVEIDDKEIRIQGMNGNYLSVTPEDIELFDYKWNGVSIKAQTSSVVIPILQENFVR